MATNPPRKPPDHDTATVTTEFNHVSSTAGSSLLLKQRRSTCSCSNIAIMQLFHEMKQKFPTVPDHVVSDLVTANCHNRPACIDSLEKAVAGTPATAQAYPSQVIHNTSLKRRINERKLCSMEHSFSGGSSGSSSRESSVDKTSSGGRFHNNNASPPVAAAAAAEVPRDGNGNVNSADNQHPASTVTTSSPAFDSNGNVPPNRPNTLAFSGPRPTRVAPPIPPISSTITASPELGETVNVQLNVTVSPVASRSPLGQRHTSVLQLQPEAPYSRELAQASTVFNAATGPLPPGANSRSSTSVNLTLRQPSEGPQSPIHIHASPLKYTAKGFNAQSGIQSKLEITFRDGFGSISAMRTHVPGFEQQQGGVVAAAATADNHLYQEQQIAVNAAQLENDGLERAQRYENYMTEVAITHQLDQKNRLSEEVDRYRQQLESIRREIRILQHPLSRSDADQLAREVQLLEEEVDQMQKEVDHQQAQLSIEGSPSQPTGPYVNRPPRPPRPPPPKFSTSQQQLPAAAAAPADGRYQGGRSISAPALPHDPQQQHHPATAGEQWTCSLCTFQNHELMTRCEVCSLPKMPGRLSSQSSLPQGPSGPTPSPSSNAAVAPASASLLVAASAPVATAVVLQTSAAAAAAVGSPSSSSSASSTASTPQTQPPPPPIQSAQFQKSSIEC
uniref:Putative cue domain found in the of tgf-beta-activated kinase 1 and map3k7-binding protein tab2 n=1 Tax=Culex tarsalis TaxID=7177 RepID=A0A1Q3G1D9_CULTA